MARSSALNVAPKFLRKRRKWPHSPLKAKWHLTFNHQQAMQNLKNSLIPPQLQQISTKPHILSSLIHSFSIYNSNPTPTAYHFVLKTLTLTSQFHDIPAVLDHLERNEEFETPEYIFTDLIENYGNAGKIREAVDVFHGIPNFRCVPSVCSLNALLLLLCRNKEGLKTVHEILLKGHLMNIRVEESCFRILITALCNVNKVGHAIKMLNCMINDGFSVDPSLCSLLLNSVSQQKYDNPSFDIIMFFEELRKTGFSPGLRDYANVMRFLVNQGRGMIALNVLKNMKTDGIKPDIFCYTITLNGIIAEGQYIKADKLFDELLVLGLVPDVYTYTIYIDGLCVQNKIEAATKMIASMEQLGCKPNVITYNTLLGALVKLGNMSRARELVEKMKSKGVGVNFLTYKIMMDNFVSQGEIIEACGLLEEALDMCCCERSSTVDNVVMGLCEKGLIGEGVEMVRKMADKGVSPGVKVWETLLG